MQLLSDTELLKFTGTQESQYLIRPSELIERVLELQQARRSRQGFAVGDYLPWSKTHKHIGLRPAEVSLWAGINGHGKSNLLSQVCAWNLRSKKWLIASMEMLPTATMDRMTQQTAGCDPSEDYTERFSRWTDDRLWIYDQTDSVKPERILAVVYYAATELKVDHIIIDSLMKCGIKKQDSDEQVTFVDRLCWLAKNTGCHIHLVHHIRKGDKETRVPNKFDIRGAGEVTDLVDNVFIIYRNKAKEQKIRARKEVDPEDPDCLLINEKQRHGEWEGIIKLWFDLPSKQYIPTPENRVMAYAFD